MLEEKRNNKPDVVLKKYWENKERFSDFFNAVLFDGKTVIRPEELEDLDGIGDKNITETSDSEKKAFSNYVKSISNMEKVFKLYKAGQTFDKDLIEETSSQILELVE